MEHLKPVHFGHFQIKEDQVRNRILCAIGELAIAAQLTNGRRPAVRRLQKEGHSCIPAGALDQEQVIRIIIDVEQGSHSLWLDFG